MPSLLHTHTHPHTRYLHIYVLSYRTCPCLFQLFLSACCVLCFILSSMSALYPPAPQVFPQPARDPLFLLGQSFSNVTACNVFVFRLFRALGTLPLVIQRWVICDLLLLPLRGSDTTQTAFPIGEQIRSGRLVWRRHRGGCLR